MGLAAADAILFGSLRLSVRERTLAGPGGDIALPSRAFDLLLTLIESRAAIVGKGELMRRVWGEVVVQENNLHVQVSAVRRALGAEHRLVQTVPGRGYRFIGDVRPAQHEPPRRGPDDAVRPATLNNLPVQMTEMIGRQDELAATVALLATARLVTLVGPGGVGKTKLALSAASVMAEQLPGGCWFAELGETAEPSVALSGLARELGLPDAVDETLPERLATWLQDRETLLLLDGCEHVAEPIAHLVRRLLQTCSRLRILCTSQTPLGLEGEHLRRIDPFELPEGAVSAAAAMGFDAVRLFVERATAVDGRFRLTDEAAAAVMQICRAVDGMPLAIELAAARAPVLGLEPLRARLADRLAMLDGERRDLPQRHRSLRAAIGWSYGLLGELERRVLGRLTVFPGDFTLAAAQEVAAGDGVTALDVIASLAALVQRSLVATGADLIRPRHRLLQVVREFVQQQPEHQSERAALARRHALYFLGLAEAADDPARRSVAPPARLGAEADNLRAALAWCFASGGDVAIGVRLAAATAGFWRELGHAPEADAWLGQAADAEGPGGRRRHGEIDRFLGPRPEETAALRH